MANTIFWFNLKINVMEEKMHSKIDENHYTKLKAKFLWNKDFVRMLLTIVIPVTLQNTVVFLINMLDTVMLGTIGDIAVSSASLANQPFFLFNMLTLGLGSGAAVLTAQYWGKKDMMPIKKIFVMIIKVSVSIGFLLTIVVAIFPEQVMGLMTPDPMLIENGASYLKIIAYSYVLFGLTGVFFTAARSVEIVKIAVVSNVIALLVNGSLNYILIFGKFGAPELGIRGAAIATLIARTIEFLIVAIYILFIDKRIKITIKDFFVKDKLLFADLVKISTPVVLNEFMWAFGITMQAVLLGQLGVVAVAANSIVSVVQQLATVAVMGFASAAAVMVGKAIGEGDMVCARNTGHTFKVLSIIVGVVVSILIILIKDVAISFYNVSEETKVLAGQLMYVAAVVGFMVSIAATGVVGILRGGGDTKFSLWIEIISLWFFAIPLAFFSAFVLKLNVVAVYAIMKIDEPIKNILLLIRLRGTKWLRDVTREETDLSNAEKQE